MEEPDLVDLVDGDLDMTTPPLDGFIFRIDEQIDNVSFDSTARIECDRIPDSLKVYD